MQLKFLPTITVERKKALSMNSLGEGNTALFHLEF